VLIGPEASDAALAARRRELVTQPERFIAQELVALSTHPTFDGDGIYPHHVDLRAFVHLRATTDASVSAHVLPAALTRVASRGSRIVNSSSGGEARSPGFSPPRRRRTPRHSTEAGICAVSAVSSAGMGEQRMLAL